jgi:hypothetical protein
MEAVFIFHIFISISHLAGTACDVCDGRLDKSSLMDRENLQKGRRKIRK